MKSIYTVVPDVYELLRRKDSWFTPAIADDLAKTLSQRLQVHFNPTQRSGLRLSAIDRYKCPRALWYSINRPDLAEPLPPQAMLKYAYGHIIEALLICLIRASGHSVEGEQDECNVDGITGHRDCVVDGHVSDVKSSSTRGMEKFEKGTLWQEDVDLFGYLGQLDGYLHGGQRDPLVLNKNTGFIFAVDKQLGHIVPYRHEFREDWIKRKVADCKRIVALPEPPPCECKSVPLYKANPFGNLKLDTAASYNPYKYDCNPSLRTFIYANGPVYLTRVIKEPLPSVLEVDRFGNPITRGLTIG